MTGIAGRNSYNRLQRATWTVLGLVLLMFLAGCGTTGNLGNLEKGVVAEWNLTPAEGLQGKGKCDKAPTAVREYEIAYQFKPSISGWAIPWQLFNVMSLGAYVPFTPWYKAFEIRKRIIVTTFSGDGSIQQVEEREGYARCQFREPLLLVESRMLADARYLCFEYCRLVAHIPTPVNEKERYRLLQTVPTGVVHDVTPGVIERFQRDLNSGDLSFGTDEGNESSRMLVNIVLLFGVNNQRVESVDFGEYVVVRDASGVIMKKESERWTADFKRGHSKKKQLWRLLSMW